MSTFPDQSNPSSLPQTPNTKGPANPFDTTEHLPLSRIPTEKSSADPNNETTTSTTKKGPYPCGSAFYLHPTTRTSLEQQRSASAVNLGGVRPSQDLDFQYGNNSRTHVFDSSLKEKDLENGTTIQVASTTPISNKQSNVSFANKSSTSSSRPKSWCQAKTMAGSRERGCYPLNKLSKRNRLIAKLLIGLFIIGVAVAVGVGISISRGTGVWAAHDQTKPIGGGSRR